MSKEIYKPSILFVTRDISYVGGTERFMSDFIVYAARAVCGQTLLFETDGHAQYSNVDVYTDLEDVAVKMIKSRNPENSFWNPENASQLQKIIADFGVTIIHSFLFNADFTVLMAKLGSTLTHVLIERIPDYGKLCCIESGLNYTTGINLKRVSFPRWHSTKFCSFSLALEKDSNEWRIKKEIIDTQLEPLVSKYTDKIHVVTKENKNIWEQWNKSVSISPCCSVGIADLALIDNLDGKEKVSKKSLPGKVFAVVSRLVPGKGLESLVKNFLKHIKSFPLDTLLIGGEGELRTTLERIGKSSPNIHFLGELKRIGVFRTFLSCDVAILLSESEGLPLVIQEAMACKKPIIATNIGGLPELVNNDVNGRLIPVNSSAAITDCLAYFSLLPRKNLREMGLNSRKIIEKNYLKEVVFDNIIQKYNL